MNCIYISLLSILLLSSCSDKDRKQNMDVNHINNLEWTVLLEAIILTDGGEVYQNIIKVLITHSANVNLPDKEGVICQKKRL